MVKSMVLLGMILLYSGILDAQEISGLVIPPEFPQRVNLLYCLEIEEDFFSTAHKTGSFIWDDFSGPFPDQQEVWHQSLETVLGNSKKVAQVLRSAKGTDLFSQAVSRGIPVFIHIKVSGDSDTAQVRYAFRGVFSDRYVFENSFEEGIPREDDLLSYFWLSLSSDFDVFLEQVLIRPPLLIQGPAETLVYGFSKEPIRIPDTEYIFVDVPIPGVYKWKMVHKGYMNREGIFMADRDHLVLTLPRDRYSFLNFLRFLDGDNKTTK